MRNLLAGILANIFINALEEKFFYKFSTATLGIVSYSRYVDDILVIYEGPATGIDHIFILFNGLHENITFTCELENEALQLNFLDLTLTVEENKTSSNIYWKETYADQIVPTCSMHSQCHKTAFFHTAIHRAISIPLLKEKFEEEIGLLKTKEVNNEYDPALIDNIL